MVMLIGSFAIQESLHLKVKFQFCSIQIGVIVPKQQGGSKARGQSRHQHMDEQEDYRFDDAHPAQQVCNRVSRQDEYQQRNNQYDHNQQVSHWIPMSHGHQFGPPQHQPQRYLPQNSSNTRNVRNQTPMMIQKDLRIIEQQYHPNPHPNFGFIQNYGEDIEEGSKETPIEIQQERTPPLEEHTESVYDTEKMDSSEERREDEEMTNRLEADQMNGEFSDIQEEQ
ncbi:hypothetical protein FGO68_gene16555 [Halteria grandinella]|uniref:Uncharacterized protein n=1 Tax=Halteria grandinella TaxID=5974 RepID=A0A8J8NZX8_HALGN|nr:hypothetical protein FGO68_gene16555 [Halteria grandinella]